MLLAEGFEPRAEVGFQPDGQQGAGIVLLRRPRPVAGQFQQGGRAHESLLPVSRLGVQLFAFDPAPLPDGIVGVLDRQRRQGVAFATAVARVEAAQFVDQHAHGPAVGNDMMQGDQQHVFVGRQPDQAASRQRAPGQIERRLGFLFGEPGQGGRGAGVGTEIVFQEREAAVSVQNQLAGLAVLLDEECAQGFVTGHDPVQGAPQGRHVQRARQPYPAGDMIGFAGTFHLGEKPEPLLSEGQR